MVNPPVRPLLALGLATLERAKFFFVCRLFAHALTLALAFAGAYALSQHDEAHKGLHEAIEIGAAILALLSELAALALHHGGLELHSLGRRIMRTVMLADGTGSANPDEAMAEFEPQVGAAVLRQAEALREADAAKPPEKRYVDNYYCSTHPLGSARLRDHLLESSIFSAELYAAAWKFSLVVQIGFLLAAIGTLYLTVGSSADLLLRGLIVLVSFIPFSQELDHLLIYRMSAHHLHALALRIEAHYNPALDSELDTQVVKEFADYGAATTFAPPIRTLVYWWLDEKLATAFKAKLASIGRSAGSPAVPTSPPSEGKSQT